MQGMTKKTPGPRAPPATRRPSLKMTARSYSCTTLTVNKREVGRVTKIRKIDNNVIRKEQMSAPSSHSEIRILS